MTVFDFRSEVKQELLRILDYWMKYAVEKNRDGFYGVVNENNIPDEKAPKAIVITSRIVWTYSAAQQLFPNSSYPPIAKRAFDYLKKYFVDKEYGGVYWSVASDGSPLQTKKQLYGHAFALYGLAEYYKITKDNAVLSLAIDIFSKMIEHSYDKVNGGYTEAFERDWSNTDDYILSKAPNSKSMNTHLHLLEAYTNLYRVWKTESSRFHLKHAIEVMLNHIIDQSVNRMNLFFTSDWQIKSTIISYGHDIEASWLLYEAAEVLEDKALLDKCRDVSIKMAVAAIDGLAEDGAMNYEINTTSRHLNDEKSWWPQAEAMVGFLNAYQLMDEVNYLQKSQKVWEFIKKYLIDYKNGEWFGGVDVNHKVTGTDKVTFWKCPYHNSRSCMEVWRRLGK